MSDKDKDKDKDKADTDALRADLDKVNAPEAQQSVLGLIERLKPEIERSLQSREGAEILARHYYTAIRFTPQLLACTAQSLVGALLLSAQVRLEPGPLGHVYLVPFGGECVWMLGYTGIAELGRRGGAVGLRATVVWDVDEYELPWENEKGRHWLHKPGPESAREERVGVLVTWREGTERMAFHVEPAEIDRALKASRMRDASRREQDWYWRKTGVRRVRPWLPASTDLAYATASDDGLVTGVDSLDVGDGALAVPALDPSEAT